MKYPNAHLPSLRALENERAAILARLRALETFLSRLEERVASEPGEESSEIGVAFEAYHSISC